MSYFPPTGSVVAFQSNPNNLVGTVSIVGTIPFNNSSVIVVQPTSGNLRAQVQGNAASGAADAMNPLKAGGRYNITPPTLDDGDVGDLQVDVNGNLKVAGTFTPPANQSVSGTVVVNQGTTPWVVNMPSPSVVSYQLAGSVLAVSGSFSGGNSSVQVVGQMPPQSVSGVGVFSTNHIGNGSVITLWPLASIAGTYAEDSAHTGGDRGLFALGVRNDTASSVTSADSDYSPIAVDAVGRTLTKPFASDQAMIQGVSSTVNTISTSLIGAAGAGLRNYLTDILVTNTGSVTTLVNFLDGDNSVIGRTIAPATGGSNIHLAFPMKTGGFNQQIHFVSQTPVSVLGVSGYGYRAQ